MLKVAFVDLNYYQKIGHFKQTHLLFHTHPRNRVYFYASGGGVDDDVFEEKHENRQKQSVLDVLKH